MSVLSSSLERTIPRPGIPHCPSQNQCTLHVAPVTPTLYCLLKCTDNSSISMVSERRLSFLNRSSISKPPTATLRLPSFLNYPSTTSAVTRHRLQNPRAVFPPSHNPPPHSLRQAPTSSSPTLFFASSSPQRTSKLVCKDIASFQSNFRDGGCGVRTAVLSLLRCFFRQRGFVEKIRRSRNPVLSALICGRMSSMRETRKGGKVRAAEADRVAFSEGPAGAHPTHEFCPIKAQALIS